MNTIAISANTSWYIYNFRLNTIKALLQKGFKVIIIAPRDNYSCEFNKLDVTYIPINIDQGGTNPLKDIKTFLSFLSIYRKYRPDIVLNFTPKNNIYGTLSASFFNAACINNISGLGMVFIEENYISKIARFLYKYSQSKAKKIFFQNNDDKRLFEKYCLAPTVLTERLPGSGVDLSRFTVSSAPDDGIVRFLLVARMLFDKGILQYVEAARKLKRKYNDKIEFRLLGFLDVNNPSSISKQQMDLWEQEGVIIYLGVSDKVEYEIAAVDCIVLPSYYREGVPKSLLEAGAMGKPIVTTNNVGCRETVDDNITGFLCEPKSTDSLCSKLEKIICMNHEERVSMGKMSRIKIETNFDENIVIDKYIESINEIINSNSPV